MAYKTIVTVMTNLETDRDALEAAIVLTRQQMGHLDILCLGLDRTEPGFFYAGASAIAVQHNTTQATEEAEALEAAVAQRLQTEEIAYSIRRAAVPTVGMVPFVAHRVRLADLAILPKPYCAGQGHESEAILEAAMFNGSVPVMVVPPGGQVPEPGAPVVVAWNESREALAAIRASLPFLQQSGRVNLALVDPPSHGPDRSDPGGELGEALSRHGVHAEVSVLARSMPRISEILCRHSRDIGAGLIVMGAYGHSRFREAILGGATRDMLEMTEIPILLAR